MVISGAKGLVAEMIAAVCLDKIHYRVRNRLRWQTAEALFQTLDKKHRLSGAGISRRDMLRVVKERCTKAELPEGICNHTFRGTGITVFLQNGGSLEAAHTWRIIPTRAPPNSMTGARTLRRSAKLSAGLLLNDR